MLHDREVASRSGSTELVDELLAASRLLVAMAADSLTELGEDVTLGQYRALVILATNGPLRTSELADQLGSASSTVTRMCDRLDRRNLIRRYRRSDDRRATWVSLTEPGRVLVGEVMRRRRASIARLAKAVPPDQRAGVTAGLRAFVEASGEPTESDWWRRWRASADPDPLTVTG
jgi:DNA-binding MarR family transcriptional regulator